MRKEKLLFCMGCKVSDRGDTMFCTYCGNTINEGAKFCQYCGKKTVLAAKGSLTEDTIPNYPGEEYTIVYSKNGQGESRVEKVSDRRAYQPGERTVDEQDRGGYYASQARSAYGGRTGGHAQDTGRMSSCAQEAGAMNGYAQETGRMGSYAQEAGAMSGYAQEAGRMGSYAQETGRMGSYAQEAGAMGSYAQEAGRMGSYAQEAGAMSGNTPDAFEQAAEFRRNAPDEAYTSKVFNSPVLGVAGLKEGDPNREHPEEEEDDSKGNGILIALIVILILLILLVGFSAFAYIQGLIDF